MSNLKYKLEALLFSSAREMKVEELTTLTKSTPEKVREALKQIKEEYEKRDSSITLIDYGDSFKLNVKSEHSPIIHQVVTETELSKTLIETLAVIAFKYPIKQSDLIKIRTNKAYDHLAHLEENGYITRQKYGRTKLIKLAPKFFEYFDLPEEKLKQKFEGFEGIAKAIKGKEEEIKKIKEEQKKKAEEAGKKDKEVDLIDEQGHKKKLETFEETEQELEEQEAKEVKPYSDKVGNLEVTDVPEKKREEQESAEEETTEEGIEMTEEMGKEVVGEVGEMVGKEETSEEQTTEEPEDKSSKSSKEVESEVDQAVEAMLHPKEETTEEEPPEVKDEDQEIPKKIEDLPDKEEIKHTDPKKSKKEPKDLLEAAEEEKDENTPS